MKYEDKERLLKEGFIAQVGDRYGSTPCTYDNWDEVKRIIQEAFDFNIEDEPGWCYDDAGNFQFIEFLPDHPDWFKEETGKTPEDWLDYADY